MAEYARCDGEEGANLLGTRMDLSASNARV